MAEVVREFRTTVTAPDGHAYGARACGAAARDGTRRWHGWIEFVDHEGAPAIRTPRETTQRNRTDIAYWADGLTLHYLEGALDRALNPIVVRPKLPPVVLTCRCRRPISLDGTYARALRIVQRRLLAHGAQTGRTARWRDPDPDDHAT